MKYLKLFMYFILIFCFIEFILFTIVRQYKRKKNFKNAEEDSKKFNLPLMVVGDPDGGWFCRHFGRTYNCGDLCVDLKGCPNCKNSIQDNILNVLKDKDDNSYIIFESCVLEYVNDDEYQEIVKEMNRVGKKVYNVRISPSFLCLFKSFTKLLE